MAYHADNGIFKSKKWVENCATNLQALTFAGVGAHHSNGIAERRIQELRNLARTMLIHANKRWPKAINSNLWPYALRTANVVNNLAPLMADPSKRSPEQLFSRTQVEVNKKHHMHLDALSMFSKVNCNPHQRYKTSV